MDFFPYTQAESSSKHKGTGLGLAICKQLISMMNGTITLYSQLGHGTQFLIDIPVKHRKTLEFRFRHFIRPQK
ncbi:hypothetical protein J4731_22780 [Providencia rettgeri]|nr:hypothetical protein [Providencia rettgeri]